MRTEHVEYLLPEYLNGTLADSHRPAVEEHLKYCGSCSTELAELKLTMEMLNTHGIAAPPGGYFATIVPSVRARLEGEEPRNVFSNPLLTRFALPVGAAALALIILLSYPFPGNETQTVHNPLQDVMHGSTTDEMINVVLDMIPLQPLSSPIVEGETSSLLGVGLLRGEALLAGGDETSFAQDLSQDETMPEGLEELSDADIEVLIQHLGERTIL